MTCRTEVASLLAWLLAAAAGAGEPGDLPHVPALAWEPRSDWVSVKGLGAVGDGVADDTAAIQKALDGVREGSTIYFPAGTYRVTNTVSMKGPHCGVTLIGHGRDTRLVWDGAAGGALMGDDGFAETRFVGLTLDGRGKAAVDFLHHSDRRFETEVRHIHMAFLGFTEAGVFADPKDKFALAETSFENCLFDACRRGVSFTSFNDYNYTFDGCEFRRCGIAIECKHGNFYARNSHFEGSTDVDILSAPEHGSSVRRCTSVGSRQFLRYANPVSPMTLQDCHVAAWTGPDGAVSLSGAPVMIFDCVFTHPPDKEPPIRVHKAGQQLIVSENHAEGSPALVGPEGRAKLSVIPAGQRKGAIRSAQQRFLKDNVRIPAKVFDARRDFGAKGDGQADDTAAIQRAIDAARAHGKAAIAYLPLGTYKITDTLRITGADYYVGGSGFRSQLLWRGPDGGTILAIHDPQDVTLEHLAVGNHDSGQMNNAIDIHQTGSDAPSRMTYDGVFVYGMYQKQPFRKGLRLEGLGEKAVVLMPHVQGNLRIVDSARATILAGMTFEGSVVVEGKDARRTGLLGFLTRLSTLTTHGLYVRGNHSIVMSDFYVEQADNGFVLEGAPGDPEGRVTIQGAKTQFTIRKDAPAEGTAMDLRNYAGEVFLGHNQFYCEPEAVRIAHKGERPLHLFLLADFFYNTRLDVRMAPAARLTLLGCEAVGPIDKATIHPARWRPENSGAPDALAAVARALDDLRRLGEADLALTHPSSP